MSEQTEMRLSEAKRLRPRRCAKCGATEKPDWADTSGAWEDTLDPKVAVAYYCTNRQCENSSGW